MAAFNRDLKRGRIWINGMMFISLTGCVWDLSLKSRVKEPVSSVFDSVLSYNPKYLRCCFKLNFKSNYKIHLKYLLVITIFFAPHSLFYLQQEKCYSVLVLIVAVPLTFIMNLTNI